MEREIFELINHSANQYELNNRRKDYIFKYVYILESIFNKYGNKNTSSEIQLNYD